MQDRVIPVFPNDGENYTLNDSLIAGSHAERIAGLIEHLYRAFEREKLTRPLKVCPHCFAPGDVEYLKSKSLRNLSHGDISIVASKLVTTLGEPKDVAYFVPRILEAIAEGAFVDILAFSERLEQAPRDSWSAQQHEALEQLGMALLAASGSARHDLAEEPSAEAFAAAIARR